MLNSLARNFALRSLTLRSLTLRSFTRRGLAVFLAMILLVSACGSSGTGTLEGAAARIHDGACVTGNDRSLTVYSGRSQNLIGPVLEAFTCETGISVAVRWGSSSELALLLGEEGSRTPADLFLSRSPGPVGFLEAKGLLQPMDRALLELVSREHRGANGTWVGFSGRQRVLVYNVDKIAQSDLPASLFDLTAEQWRGQIAIPATNGSFVDWFTVFRHSHGDSVAGEWLDGMVANEARPYPNNRSIVEAASRGEIAAGLVNHYYNFQEQAALGDDHRARNHDFSESDIGSLLIITAATITASADDGDSAESLLRYLLSEPVQTYLTTETFEYPLALGVEAAEVLPPLDADAVGSIDFDDLGEGFAESTAIIEASGILNQ